MSKVINITDKFSTELPSIQIGEKLYPVNNGISAMMAFEEASTGGIAGILKALEGAFGKKAYKEMVVEDMSMGNIMVLASAVLAAMMNITYEEANARFQREVQS
ncbi:hypothetical protein [Paenibacillus sp. DR312]|uniref:hypothetical protein n=1 Tax=unclassified Paenibacillus TaxID=185978 RepID=UPI001C974901|nr:hypothetical protein [Paenibacillus sp. DR312]QZN77376.1 hypothetical protein K5K90_09345 [Paenibacillus sp. DR312]